MKILITGISGYVGAIVARHLMRSHDVIGVDLKGDSGSNRFICDLTDWSAVERLAHEVAPEIVIHAAGNKNIELCEKNPNAAFRINCDAVKYVAQAFGSRSRIIYLSTDYVFDGIRGSYNELDHPEPRTVYGRSKFLGEREGQTKAGDKFIILRMSALYDLHAVFPHFLLECFAKGKRVDCFSDVRYSPTYYRDFLSVLEKIMATAIMPEHIFHICGEVVTRYEFARTLALVFDFDLSLVRKASAAGMGTYLYSDLSLSNKRMRNLLQIKPTAIFDALKEMKDGTLP